MVHIQGIIGYCHNCHNSGQLSLQISQSRESHIKCEYCNWRTSLSELFNNLEELHASLEQVMIRLPKKSAKTPASDSQPNGEKHG